MKIQLKIKEFELLDKDTLLITTNMEDFKAMLDKVNPLHLTDYLCETIKKLKKGGSHESK